MALPAPNARRRCPCGGPRCRVEELLDYRDGAITGSVVVDVSDPHPGDGQPLGRVAGRSMADIGSSSPCRAGGRGVAVALAVVMLADLDSGEVVLPGSAGRPHRLAGRQGLGSCHRQRCECRRNGMAAVAAQRWSCVHGDDTGQSCLRPVHLLVNITPDGWACSSRTAAWRTNPPRPVGNFAKALQGLVPGNLGLSRDHTELRAEGLRRRAATSAAACLRCRCRQSVQRPPFSDGVRLEVNAGGDGLNLERRHRRMRRSLEHWWRRRW